jgi:hypothetical protein
MAWWRSHWEHWTSQGGTRCKHCRRELSSGSWVKADQSREVRNNRPNRI